MALSADASPLRVLVVIPGAPQDNSMVFSRRQAKALRAHHPAEVEVFFLQSRLSPSGLLAERKRFKEVARRFRPEVVHVHYGTITALFTVLVSPVPVVITYHGSDLNRTPNDGFLRDLLGRTCSQIAALGAKAIICVSTDLRNKLWWRRSRVHILPMGVEMDKYVPLPRAEARQRLEWEQRPHVVVFNASRPAIKRLDIAQQVEQLLRHRGVAMELELLKGGVTQEEMPVILSAADALLLCSNSEGSPTMVKEAMACDLPVVTSDVGDVRERLAGVEPGAIVRQDVNELADALQRVLAEGRRSNGRALAERNGIDAASLDAATFALLRTVARKVPG